MRRLVPALIAAALTGIVAPAQAQVPIEQNETVREGFYAIGLADEVRRNCPSIRPRLVRAYSFLRSLESHAREVGYSDSEIQALTENDAAKEALRADIREDLAARGATADNTEGYCEVGREEIARGTQAGRLLQSN